MNRLPVVLISIVLASAAVSPQGRVPSFEVDPSWPAPLPNHWVVGEVAGIAVDSTDHIWVLQRPRTVGRVARGNATPIPPPPPGSVAAPSVLEFDTSGKLLTAWGGPDGGTDWVANEHGLSVDSRNNVWVAGGGAGDTQVLKFSSDGKLRMAIGKKAPVGSNADPTILDRPTDAVVDPATNEVYVTDGEVGGSHRRVLVYDADTGAFKRMWGAYGNKPEEGPIAPYDPAAPLSKQFGTATHCVRISRDGFVYICDRSNNRIQVFRKDGTFVKEGIVEKQTGGLGAIWDLELSPDRNQTYVYVADGQNQKIWILNRQTLDILGSFGSDGHAPGQIRGVNAIAADSKGNLYIAEANDGRRVQKFMMQP